jgi:ferredoxin-NADP reductase
MFTQQLARRTLTSRVLASGLVDLLTGPHGVDRYTEIVNPVWTLGEARAEVVEVARSTPRSVTLKLRPNHSFSGFKAGQHVNVRIEIDGRRHTRCYSPANAEGAELLELTVGVHDGGLVSTFLREHARPGLVVGLDGVGGDFVLPDELPERIAFVSGGSGITPVLSMLRTLVAHGHNSEITFLHYARSAAEACYREELTELDVRVLHGYTRETAGTDVGPRFERGLIGDAAVFACGPPSLVDAVREHYPDARSESFVPPTFVVPAEAGGGQIAFLQSGASVIDDGRSLLEQAEAAGLSPESGCRMGICHGCKCRKRSGAVRNLITGAVSSADEEDVQICVSVPVGDVELAL